MRKRTAALNHCNHCNHCILSSKRWFSSPWCSFSKIFKVNQSSTINCIRPHPFQHVQSLTHQMTSNVCILSSKRWFSCPWCSFISHLMEASEARLGHKLLHIWQFQTVLKASFQNSAVLLKFCAVKLKKRQQRPTEISESGARVRTNLLYSTN